VQFILAPGERVAAVNTMKRTRRYLGAQLWGARAQVAVVGESSGNVQCSCLLLDQFSIEH
jgi:hypothetical protein